MLKKFPQASDTERSQTLAQKLSDVERRISGVREAFLESPSNVRRRQQLKTPFSRKMSLFKLTICKMENGNATTSIMLLIRSVNPVFL